MRKSAQIQNQPQQINDPGILQKRSSPNALFLDNRPSAASQRATVDMIDHSPRLVAQRASIAKISQGAPVQLIRNGYIPHGFAVAPYAGVADPANARGGDEAFSDAQKNAVYTANINAHMVAPPVPVDDGPISDEGGNQLMSRNEATDLTPEIDHIWTRAEEGANDLRNARVLSKRENNAAGTTRPAGNEKRMAVYDNITVTNGPFGGNWAANAGDILTLARMGDLRRYANNENQPASWAATTPNMAIQIHNAAPGATNNGVTVV